MNEALQQHLATLGLERSPFPPTPDAASYYCTPQLESDLVEVGHALRMHTGFVLLTGEVGTGKSTFLRRLVDQLERDGTAVSLVFNTFLQGDDLLAAVLRDFGLKPSGNPADDIEVLNRFLVNRWKQRAGSVLIIDDAQNLTPASLELVRLLTNLETDQEKLLQIVLSGQPELMDNLALPQMRQLTSRVSKHVRLQALSKVQTRRYVDFRLKAAGSDDTVHVSADAISALYRCSAGNPRRIHLIMDRSLYALYGQPSKQRSITASIIKQAAGEAGAIVTKRSPPAPLKLAASVVLATGAALGVGLYAGSPTTGSANAATPVPTVPPTALAADTSQPTQRCEPDRFAYRMAIPEPTARYLGRSPELCVTHSDGSWMAHWNTPAEATAFDAPNSAPNTALERIQRQLHEMGQYDGPVDGRYGRLTQRAISRVQSIHSLPATGVADTATQALIHALYRDSNTLHSELAQHGHG